MYVRCSGLFVPGKTMLDTQRYPALKGMLRRQARRARDHAITMTTPREQWAATAMMLRMGSMLSLDLFCMSSIIVILTCD